MDNLYTNIETLCKSRRITITTMCKESGAARGSLCRHSFRTQIDGANKVCIDLIMGHKTGDVGERVYTHKTIEELKEAINTLAY